MPAMELTPHARLVLQCRLVEQLHAHRGLILWIWVFFPALLVIDDAGIIRAFVCPLLLLTSEKLRGCHGSCQDLWVMLLTWATVGGTVRLRNAASCG